MAAKKRRERAITVRLREDEYAALEAEAEEREVAIADVVRQEIGRVVRKWRRAGVLTARPAGGEPSAADVYRDLPDEAKRQ